MLTPAHVEVYVHIRADGFRHFGYRIDEALSFCQQVERRLEKLPKRYRDIILWQAMGYTQAQMARMVGRSTRAMNFHVQDANRLAYGDLMRELSTTSIKKKTHRRNKL